MKVAVLADGQKASWWQSASLACPEIEFLSWSPNAGLPATLKLFNKAWAWQRLAKNRNINLVALTDAATKLTYTAPAIAGGWRVVWLETVDNGREANNIRLADLSRQVSWLATSAGDFQLRCRYGWDEQSGRLVRPLLDWAAIDSQCHESALPTRRWSATELLLGVWQQWEDLQNLEFLFKLVATCRDIGLQLRLVVFGDGPATKQARWLVEKMALSAQIQFVAVRQSGAYFGGLDALILNNRQLDQSDYQTALQAVAVGTPIWSQANPAFVDVCDTALGHVALQWSSLDDQAAVLRAWAKELPARRHFVDNCQRWASSQCDPAASALAWRRAFGLN